MKTRAIIAAALSLIVLQFVTAANVQPILTGAGLIKFPENSTPATISASSGALTAASGGSNQSLFLNPSGTGAASINSASPWSGSKLWVHSSTNANIALSDGSFGGGLGSGVGIHALNDAANANVPLDIRGSTVRITGNTLFSGGAGTASYPVDAVGDVNASGVFRKAGTAGVGSGSTVTVCSSVAAGPPASCSSSCTLQFTGGIRTGGTCP